MKRTPFLFSAATPMAKRCAGHLWAETPLGEPRAWDSALKTLVPIVLGSNQPMFVAWGESRTLIYNDAYAEILADKHPDALGRDFLDVWQEIREDLLPIVGDAYAGTPVQMDDIELWMERRGFSEETHFSFSYSPVRNETGEVAGFFCACNEITSQILAERRLAESEARHRGVLENIDEGFDLLDRDFTVIEANPAALRMAGLSREQKIGHNYWELFPGTRDSVVGDLYRQVLKDRVPGSLQLSYRFPDGREGWFEARAFPVGDYLAVVSRDITETKRLQQEADASLEHIQLALEAGAILGTWMWDIQNDLLFGNEQFAASFGLDAAALKKGVPLELAITIVHPDDRDRVQLAVEDAVARRGRYRCQYRVLRDGQPHWVEANGRVEVDAEGVPSRFPGVLLDIEDRKRTEDERDRMLEALRDADRRKDEFLAMLAHELRNPLAPINTAAHILRMTAADSKPVQDAGQIIARQVGHLTKLVDDLLDVSRVTRGLVPLDLQPVDLRSVVSTAIEQAQPLMQSRNHELRTKVRTGPSMVQGDFHRLVQIVSNLLNNAAKYTPQGGVIALELGSNDGQAVLTVSDNGVGIAPDTINRVFDLFAQAERTPDRSQGGLGIGLSLVRSLVQLHGGTVTATSAGVSQGSTFRVTLPLAAESAGAAPRPSTASQPARLRILVVDDNVDAATTLADVLRLSGHTVEIAEDGEAALRKVAAVNDWNVFILDIGLPDMTGYELASRIREVPAGARSTLIALTGYGQAHDRVISKTAGFDHHLVKPANINELMDLLAGVSPG